MSEGKDMKAAALWYAKNGIPVFPCHYPADGGCSCRDPKCHTPAKHPLTEHGFKDATTDLAKIAQWWDRWPTANIAIPMGSTTRRLAVDSDPRNGGPSTPPDFIEQFGSIDGAAEQITGSGGGARHYVFSYAGGSVPRELSPGVDVKGEGGYIMVAPSLHMSGNRYQWDGIEGPKTLLHPAEAPAWLIERIAAARNGSTRAAPVADGEQWGKGQRNDKLTSVAGTMRRRGLTREAIEAALLQENRQRCDPPLAEAEVRGIAASVARYEPACDGSGPKHEEPGGSSLSRWPDPPSEEAFHGVAGEWVRLVEPHTEADPAALLLQFVVAFGSLIGRGPHCRAEADRHFTNLFAVIVGQTAKGRKGTSLGQVQAALKAIDTGWADTRIMGGLSSGEGLIWGVRDEIRERVPIKDKRRIVEYEEQVTDEGEKDKRLLVTESEFASVLQRAERETNTLSAIIRQAWDTGSLRVLTKKQTAKATDAHISIIGHITRDELRRLLNASETANGFANRFLWVCSKRSKCLPDGGALDQVDRSALTRRLQDAANLARTINLMERDSDARAIWHQVYPGLSEGKPGLLGAVTSRGEAQVLRLSCLYALLDGSASVRAVHLMAALAVWQYCENSARFIFGDALGDGTADEILRELRNHPEGMTRNEIREHFSRNKSAAEIARAVGALQEYGLARMVRGPEQEGQARPTERWFAVTGVRG
jgi:hypothetical protein